MSTVNSGKRVFGGAAWLYGSQLASIGAQFAYAAITSRLVSPRDFGAYAVALAATGFVTLIATGGLGQTVGRMADVDRKHIRPLMTYALLVGVVGGLALFFSAPIWSELWGAGSGAVAAIQLLSLNAFLAPVSGLLSGLARRLGKFRGLAIVIFLANLAGFVAGAFATVLSQTAVSLAVSPVVAQLLTMIGALAACGRTAMGFGPLNSARNEISFSGRMVVSNLMSYLVYNIPKLASSNVLGVGLLGQWNRADVVTTVPLQQVQTVMIQAVYPEFRHDVNSAGRAFRVWADLLTLVAWVALPAACLAAVVIPHIVPILFGDGWDLAAALVPILAIVGGLQIVTTLLASAVEALGKFRWVWSTQGVLIGVQILAALSLLVWQSFTVIGVALVVTNVARHTIHVSLCVRAGYLNGRALARGYASALAASVATAGITWLAVQSVTHLVEGQNAVWIAGFIPVAAAIGCAWRLREKLPPLKIARRYGLIG